MYPEITTEILHSEKSSKDVRAEVSEYSLQGLLCCSKSHAIAAATKSRAIAAATVLGTLLLQSFLLPGIHIVETIVDWIQKYM